MSQSNSFAETGPLKSCPNTPNCVSSQSNGSQAIDPFVLIDPIDESWQKLLSSLSSMERIKVTHSNDVAAHAEATSLIFRFVDEIDLILNEAEKRVDIRSASRIGYSDFGANRKRLEQLRSHLQAANIIR